MHVTVHRTAKTWRGCLLINLLHRPIGRRCWARPAWNNWLWHTSCPRRHKATGIGLTISRSWETHRSAIRRLYAGAWLYWLSCHDVVGRIYIVISYIWNDGISYISCWVCYRKRWGCRWERSGRFLRTIATRSGRKATDSIADTHIPHLCCNLFNLFRI